MIILVILLIIFGLAMQIVLTKAQKRNIIRRDYIALNVILYIDAVATTAFILSMHFGAPLYLKLLFKYLVFIAMNVFFLIYMHVIKSKKYKRKWITFIITTIGITVVIVFGRNFDKATTGIILLVTLLSRFIILGGTKRYPSNYIKSILILAFSTEIVRFITEAFITSDLIHYNFEDTWVPAFSFLLRAVMMIFIMDLHEQFSMDKNLAKTINFQSTAALLSQVFDQNPNVIVITDMNRKIIYTNPQASILTGYDASEMIGQTPKIFASGLTPKSTFNDLQKALSSGSAWSGEFINQKKNGEIFTEQTKIITLKDANGLPIYHLAIKNDITTEKDYLKALEYLSAHDDLTGLLRRQVFIQKLEKNLSLNLEMDHYFILLDIDEFKYINDSYGHLIGDSILIEFADTLTKIFNDKAYICRFGGDEFAIYIYDHQPEQVKLLIKALQYTLTQKHIDVISDTYRLKFSFGVTQIKLPFDFSTIYEQTDRKLYLNKLSKRELNNNKKIKGDF